MLDTEIANLSQLGDIARASPSPYGSSAQSDIANVVQELEKLDFGTELLKVDDAQGGAAK